MILVLLIIIALLLALFISTKLGLAALVASRKVFGTSKYAKKIAKANKKKVSYKFKKRQEIKIPEVQL